jgi:hypothetical protein
LDDDDDEELELVEFALVDEATDSAAKLERCETAPALELPAATDLEQRSRRIRHL